MTFFLSGSSLDEKIIKDNDTKSDGSTFSVVEAALCDRLTGNTGFVAFQGVKTH
jgi:hypothetical protein